MLEDRPPQEDEVLVYQDDKRSASGLVDKHRSVDNLRNPHIGQVDQYDLVARLQSGEVKLVIKLHDPDFSGAFKGQLHVRRSKSAARQDLAAECPLGL